MYKLVEVTGHIGAECHLLFSEQAAVLVESGCGYCAEKVVENIKRELGGRKLDAILLTHSHYDHAGGSPLIKRHFPEAVVVASGHAANIFSKESAQKVISEMESHAAKRAGITNYEDLSHMLHVDKVVEDGDVVQIKDMTLRVISAPGHTKCSICFFWEQEELFISCETLGVCIEYPEIIYCYVIGYNLTQESIEKMRSLQPKHVYVAHYGMIPDEGCATYFDSAAAAAKEAKDIIVDSFHEGLDLNGIANALKKASYDGKVDRLQPLEAFMANASVMIPRTLMDCGFSLDAQ